MRAICLAWVLCVAAMAPFVPAQGPRADRGGEADPRGWVQKKWAGLDVKDVAGRHKLMDIARDYAMYEEMRRLAGEILALDPKHREARRHLNQTLFRGKWLTPAEAQATEALARFDYEFAPGYKRPLKDRLLFPLYLTRKEHKRHAKRQYWETCWVYDKKPLVIRSNCTYQKIQRFAKTFREFARYVQDFLGIRLKSNYEINIYRSREEYHSVGKAPRGTGGYYVPSWRKLFFFDDPRDQISTYRVLFHEGTHMIVNLSHGNKAYHHPICVNEGLAEYMASARWDYYKQQFTFGHPLNDRIREFKGLLAAGRAKPLKELVLHARRGFGSREYAQAWALITYLSDPQVGNSSKKLGVYLKRLAANRYGKVQIDPRNPGNETARKKITTMQKIFERTFFNARNGTTWEEFQKKFWDYVRNMKEEVGAPDFSRRYRQRAGLLGGRDPRTTRRPKDVRSRGA